MESDPTTAIPNAAQQGMDAILEGVNRFQTVVFPENRDYYEQLVKHPQRPQALFITCADSRIHPNLLTGTRAGSLFLIRNAGNIIPPYGSGGASGEAATIEYALSVLHVKNIIVCGHSHCGAIRAMLEGKLSDEIPSVRQWFTHTESVRRLFAKKKATDITEEDVILAAEENVILQLAHLRTHPAVAVGLSQGSLNIYGWVYDLGKGKVLGLNPANGEFISLLEKEAIPLPGLRNRRTGILG